MEEKKIVHFKKERLKLPCEWSECNETHANMDTYLRHIKTHLTNHPEDDLNCCWRECGHLSGSIQEFAIHVNYHGFHTRVKCLGCNLLARKGLKNCTLSSNCRNMLPELPDKLVCSWANCAENFYDPEAYYRHVDQHIDDISGIDLKCLWEGCDGQFHTTYKMRDHLRSHTQEKLIACPTCGGLFSNRTKYFDHLKRQIPVEDQHYQCSHCSKKLASERLLRDHMRNHINHYKCPCCDMTCSSPSNLSNHIKYRHTTERPYACNFCDYSGKTQADLCKHLKTHLSEPQHKCSFAGCSFATRSEHSLKMHVLKEHKKTEMSRYCCHMCEKTFARGAYLTRHLFLKHKFRWPSGHSRFRYKQNPDGTHQLQTIRYESIELTQEMINQKSQSEDINTVHESVCDADEDVNMSAGECDDFSIDLESRDDDDNDDDEVDEESGDYAKVIKFPISSQKIELMCQPRSGQNLSNSDGKLEIMPQEHIVNISTSQEKSLAVDDSHKSLSQGLKNAITVHKECQEPFKTVFASITGPDGITQQISILVEDSMNIS